MSERYLESRAAISPDGLHRYSLLRRWAPGRLLAFFMLNPSKADALIDDRTIGKCVGFGRRLGFGAIEVGNLGAYRATDPDDFFAAGNPIGSLNDFALHEIAGRADMIIAAWGALPKRPAWARSRAESTLLDLSRRADVYALRVTAGGFPSHPLYLPGDLKPQIYRAARPASPEPKKGGP